MADKLILRCSPSLRQKSVDFINQYFPEVMADIAQYASENNAHIGDIATATITEIILPTLEPNFQRFSATKSKEGENEQ